MSKLMMFDFTCQSCGHQFEELVQPTVKVLDCPKCGWKATRDISLGHLDWKMGVSGDMPTMAAKWDRIQRQKARVDKGGIADGAPNLKMY